MRITVCIIKKNEEKNIAECLKCLKKAGFGPGGACGDIVVVDTGSSDGSRETAGRYVDRVYEYEWRDDFAAAKNHAVSLSGTDLVWVLDADEFVEEYDHAAVTAFFSSHLEAMGRIRRRNLIKADGISGVQADLTERIYDRRRYRFVHPIHEQLLPFSGEAVAAELPVCVRHTGYLLDEEGLKKKAARNIELLSAQLAGSPEDPYLYFQMAQSYMLKRDREAALEWYSKGLGFDVDPELEYVQMMVTGYGDCLLACGKKEDALGLEGVYGAFEKVPEYVFLMGQIYLANNMLIKAYGELLKCLSMKEGRTEGVTSYYAYHNIGLINEMLGEKEAAVSFYEKAGDYPRSKERLKELRGE